MRGMSQWRGIELVELNRKCSNVIETFLKALHTHFSGDREREKSICMWKRQTVFNQYFVKTLINIRIINAWTETGILGSICDNHAAATSTSTSLRELTIEIEEM